MSDIAKNTEGLHDVTEPMFKFDESLGVILGWAMVSKINGKDYFDLQNDNITEKAVFNSSVEFMLNGRAMKIMHKGESVGMTVMAWPMTTEVAKAMGIESRISGLMVMVKPDSEAALEKARSGDFTGFSIGGSQVEFSDVD